jgi:hypothetical protein
VAEAPAVDLTPNQVLDMLRRLIEANKGRTANKLRSYLRAAFQCALDVRTTASIPVVFKSFGVVFNPAAQTVDPRSSIARTSDLSPRPSCRRTGSSSPHVQASRQRR